MTRQKSFKQRIRARMDKTGESYATARRRLIEKAEAEARKQRTPQTIAPQRTKSEAILSRTGRSREEWFKLLDEGGAEKKKHAEIARWLVDEHEVDGWWSQHITVAYEQERGMRAPGQRSDGTYSVSASKTLNVPVDRVFDAFNDERLRTQWLGDYELQVRTARPGKSMTAAWEEGTTRLAIGFTDKGAAKSQVSLAHERIADARRADEMKSFWRERLNALKAVLED
ncbi:MAG: DUF4287 domain-containing protein [Actinomycetota bacterium]|nr:DUF4287 domain-containing protein [Actinomycetota bacterium]